jgi:glutaredoxin
MAHVTLYTRSGCHLCEQAKNEMLAAGCTDHYTLEEIDIDADPSLRARYGFEIPVVTINGVVAFKYCLTAAEFKRQLRQISNVSIQVSH